MDYKFEFFNSVYDFQNALNTRAENGVGNISHSGSESFTETKSFENATELLENGWNTKVEMMKSEIAKFSEVVERNQNRMVKSVQGFMPCVPNAIKGVSKSMFTLQRNPVKKQKTVHLVVNNCGTADVDAEELMRCGLAVLKLAVLLDKKNVRTQIDIVPKMSYCDDMIYGCAVKLKDYRQPLNISKIAYPMAHVSMFRRHGFRWLETTPFIDSKDKARYWSSGYGSSIYRANLSVRNKYLEAVGLKKEGVVYIDLNDCRRVDFDPYRLLDEMVKIS